MAQLFINGVLFTESEAEQLFVNGVLFSSDDASPTGSTHEASATCSMSLECSSSATATIVASASCGMLLDVDGNCSIPGEILYAACDMSATTSVDVAMTRTAVVAGYSYWECDVEIAANSSGADIEMTMTVSAAATKTKAASASCGMLMALDCSATIPTQGTYQASASLPMSLGVSAYGTHEARATCDMTLSIGPNYGQRWVYPTSTNNASSMTVAGTPSRDHNSNPVVCAASTGLTASAIVIHQSSAAAAMSLSVESTGTVA